MGFIQEKPATAHAIPWMGHANCVIKICIRNTNLSSFAYFSKIYFYFDNFRIISQSQQLFRANFFSEFCLCV